jgi:hypothetical protein
MSRGAPWLGWLALGASVVGCPENHDRLELEVGVADDVGVDASLDAATGMDTGPSLEALCAGLEPSSHACAVAFVQHLDARRCDEMRACGLEVPSWWCDAYSPREGSWGGLQYEDALTLVRVGRLRFDPIAARCILARNLTCADEFASCGEPFVAVRAPAEGAPCRHTVECGAAMWCAPWSSSVCDFGVCAPRVPDGDACGDGAPCGVGAYCIAGRCERLTAFATANLGERCGWNVEERGLTFTRCVESACRPEASDPAPGVCVQLVGLGQDCSTDLCMMGLSCVEGRCADTLAREGSPCGGEDRAWCAWGAFGLACEAGTCVRNPRLLGDPCSDWVICAEGVCVPDAMWNRRCEAPLEAPLGASCRVHGDCADALCCGGVCVAP